MDVDWGAEPDLDELGRWFDLLPTDPESAIKHLEHLAGRGSAMSAYYIASTYSRGEFIVKNRAKAKHWFRRASESGLIQGKYFLALACRHDGEYREALEALTEAAAAGHAPAMNFLAHMYFAGEGVTVNLTKARELWEESASRGSIRAKKDLGLRLMRGLYGARNMPKGLILFLSALTEFSSEYSRDRFSERLI